MSWTDERIEHLRAMWAEGSTASQIAEELGGVSRNAVIGKIHRLKLRVSSGSFHPPMAAQPKPSRQPFLTPATRHPARGGQTKPRAVHVPREVVHHDPQKSLLERFVEGYLGQQGRIGLLDLNAHHCRFPVGDRFCGLEPHSEGASWCRHHLARVCQ